MKVSGMTCDHCRHRITTALKQLEGISDVEVILEENKVIITYDEERSTIDEMLEKINDLGYETDSSQVYKDEKSFFDSKRNNIFSLAFMLIGIILMYLFIKNYFGFDFFNVIPQIDSSISLPLLFIIGLMSSIHCIGMCGAINLAASTGIKVKSSVKRPILYNTGRVISYTATGAIAGLLGKVLTPNNVMQGLLVGLAAVFMLIMGLSMLDVISRKFLSFLPKNSKLARLRTSSPLVMGLLNGLMPCGPLQAMQIYAMSTASMFLGAASMFLFAMGTVPLMFLVGMIFNSVKGKKVYVLHRVSAVLVIVLSIVMFSRAAGYLGINLSLGGNQTYEIAEVRDGYQYVDIEVQSGSYKKIMVQSGIPVKFDMHVEQGKLNGCNNTVIIPSLDIKKRLYVGDNIIEFTPEKTGTVGYSCWMSMIRSQIIVIEDLNSSVSEANG
jgi:sulfite exporter TauE/SafE/copper chaperone CopZ